MKTPAPDFERLTDAELYALAAALDGDDADPEEMADDGPADEPTEHLPGSEHKVLVLAERARLRRRLFHPGDRADAFAARPTPAEIRRKLAGAAALALPARAAAEGWTTRATADALGVPSKGVGKRLRRLRREGAAAR